MLLLLLLLVVVVVVVTHITRQAVLAVVARGMDLVDCALPLQCTRNRQALVFPLFDQVPPPVSGGASDGSHGGAQGEAWQAEATSIARVSC